MRENSDDDKFSTMSLVSGERRGMTKHEREEEENTVSWGGNRMALRIFRRTRTRISVQSTHIDLKMRRQSSQECARAQMLVFQQPWRQEDDANPLHTLQERWQDNDL